MYMIVISIMDQHGITSVDNTINLNQNCITVSSNLMLL